MSQPDKLKAMQEVQRIVAEATSDGSLVNAGRSASSITESYPDCGFTTVQLEQRIIEAASSARLPLKRIRPRFSTTVRAVDSGKRLGR